MRTSIYNIICVAALALVLTACDDFLDITPTGKVIAKTGEEYRALLTYEYKYFPKDRYLTTVRTDEVMLSENNTSSTDRDAYLDLWRWKDDSPATTTTYFGWRGYYHTIHIANYLIEHRGEIENAKTSEVNQLVGEAYMMRAYCHFILVNLYAQPYTQCAPASTRGVPLMLEADVNAIPRSSSVETVYNSILADVDQAAQLLNVDQWDEGETYRFNTVSAKALRSRVCLYMGRWQEALDAANEVIATHGELQDMNIAVSSPDYLLPNSYKSVESIVALEKFSTNENTVISHPAPAFINLYRSGDQRRTKYYKRQSSRLYDLLKEASDENVCSFRSAEAYLNAAEASVQLGKSATEIIDILTPLMQNRLNASALATTTSAMATMNQDQLLQEVYDERARELAFEGHRWFDLRRTTMPQLQKVYELKELGEDGSAQSETYTLEQGDSRYTLRFPTEAVEANPEIEIWE